MGSVLQKAIDDGLINDRTKRVCSWMNGFCDDVCIQQADSFLDYIKGARLLRDEYIRAGLINHNKVKFLHNKNLMNEGSSLIIAKKSNTVIGTISIISDNDLGMPCRKIFNESIEANFQKERKVFEVGTLSTAEEKGHNKLVFNMYFHILIKSFFIEMADDLFIQVRSEQADFYKRNLLFNEVCERKNHPDYQGVQASLLHADLREIREKLLDPKYGRMGWQRLLCELGVMAKYRDLDACNKIGKEFTPNQEHVEIFSLLCEME